jgi:hypothetical protein
VDCVIVHEIHNLRSPDQHQGTIEREEQGAHQAQLCNAFPSPEWPVLKPMKSENVVRLEQLDESAFQQAFDGKWRDVITDRSVQIFLNLYIAIRRVCEWTH